MAETYGPGAVTYLTPQELVARGWFTETNTPSDGLWATTVNTHTQRCTLYREAYGCRAHDHPSYPVACRDFPWADPLDDALPQAWDAHLCPETQRHLPYCEKCGRFPVLHSKATLCSGCFLATTTLGKLAKHGK